MASTFTTNKVFEKQGTGDNDNTWGTTLNDNAIDRIDSCFGRTSKSVAGGVDVTLTTAEARPIIQEYTGTISANINVVVPTLPAAYVVFNNTTGAFTLTVKTSGGTGVAVTQGAKIVLYCDGTNVVAATIEHNVAIQQGRHTLWIPANAFIPRTTNGPFYVTVETTTNKVMIKGLDFNKDTDQFAQAMVRMPKSWNEGTVTATVLWRHGATATNFTTKWGVQAVAFSDDDALDAAFGTAQTVTDTGGTTNDLYVTPETAAITIAGTPAAEDYVVFQAYRDADDAADNLAIDGTFLGLTIYYTVNAATDA